jgi:hypothetical protein
VSVNSQSAVEYDVSSTIIAGGTVVEAGFGVAAASVKTTIQSDRLSQYPISIGIDGNMPTALALVVTPFTGNTLVNGMLGWHEVY